MIERVRVSARERVSERERERDGTTSDAESGCLMKAASGGARIFLGEFKPRLFSSINQSVINSITMMILWQSCWMSLVCVIARSLIMIVVGLVIATRVSCALESVCKLIEPLCCFWRRWHGDSLSIHSCQHPTRWGEGLRVQEQGISTYISLSSYPHNLVGIVVAAYQMRRSLKDVEGLGPICSSTDSVEQHQALAASCMTIVRRCVRAWQSVRDGRRHTALW